MSQGEHLFKPGNQMAKGRGRPALPLELKELRKLNTVRLESILNRIAYLNIEELRQVRKAPGTTAIEAAAATIMLTAIASGDHQRLEWFLTRLVGKPKEHKAIDLKIERMRDLPKDQVIAMAKQAMSVIQGGQP